jgi:hypothetical protein
MRPQTFRPESLQNYLLDQRIATLVQLKTQLGTSSTMTVFRKLKHLGYLTSYSHRGQYYTLQRIPRFNEYGIWCLHSVFFSKYGKLQNAVLAIVDASEAGHSSDELGRLLNVDVKHALLELLRKRRLDRERLGGRWIYFGRTRTTRLAQIQSRRTLVRAGASVPIPLAAELPEFRDGLMKFFGVLDERQKRLFAGLQSMQVGHGGDHAVAELLGLDVHTVAKGRREVLSGEPVKIGRAHV